MTVPEITLAELLDWVREHPLAGGRPVSVFLWGEPGVGKTQLVRQYAAERRIGMRSYYPAHDASAATALGEPTIDPSTGRTHFAVPAFLPSRTETESINPAGILFVDEFNRAQPEIQAGLFELLGDGAISQSNYELPGGWMVVCAGNPEGGRFQVTPLDPALKDRMLHVAIAWQPQRWAQWARAQGLEEDVVRFAEEEAELIAGGVALLPAEVQREPTPRALEMFAALYEPQMPLPLLRVIAQGLLGEAAAERFLAREARAERPLTGEQMLRGLWRRYLPRWQQQPQLRDQSLAALVRLLGERDVRHDHALEVADLVEALDPAAVGRLRAALAAYAPEWLRMLQALDRPQLQARLRG